MYKVFYTPLGSSVKYIGEALGLFAAEELARNSIYLIFNHHIDGYDEEDNPITRESLPSDNPSKVDWYSDPNNPNIWLNIPLSGGTQVPGVPIFRIEKVE